MGGYPSYRVSLDGGLDGWMASVIGSCETQWLDGTGSSVSDTNGQKHGGEGGGLRDDDLAGMNGELTINWTEGG